jgi:hypothetical protein
MIIYRSVAKQILDVTIGSNEEPEQVCFFFQFVLV